MARGTRWAGVYWERVLIRNQMDTPTTNATGDDVDNTTDEDGVVFLTPISPGDDMVAVDITASLSGRLNAWVDFDGNGSWSQAGEQIFTNRLIGAGLNMLTFITPATAKVGFTYARFRLSSPGGLSPTGTANNGEVEDYRVEITPLVTSNPTSNCLSRSRPRSVHEQPHEYPGIFH